MPLSIMLTEVIKALMILRHTLSSKSTNGTKLTNLLCIKPYGIQMKLEEFAYVSGLHIKVTSIYILSVKKQPGSLLTLFSTRLMLCNSR